jgi:hypothetical protein
MQTLRGLLDAEDASGMEIMERIRLAADPARKLKESLRWSTSETDERVYWISHLDEQIQAWVGYFDSYLRWADVLQAPPDEFLLPLGDHAIAARRRLLWDLPSWGELAREESDNDFLQEVLGVRAEALLPVKVKSWMAELREERNRVRRLAKDVLDRARQLWQGMRGSCRRNRHAISVRWRPAPFGIGYQVGAPRVFTAHYDLLASEARLASLVAIAKNDIPAHHWLALGRPYTSSNGQVLLSWSGTMFEYLMPLLFVQTFRNSLLDNACASAVNRQIEYARQRGVPWGISESAYSALDIHKIYQYRAFGVPTLGLKRGLEDDLVVAPYATALALMVYPAESIKNLRRLDTAGVYGRMGFYESLDYMRRQDRQGSKPVVVYAYMAHHQGMTLTAINNVLNAGIMRRRFHADRRVRAVEPLLFERIPPQPFHACASAVGRGGNAREFGTTHTRIPNFRRRYSEPARSFAGSRTVLGDDDHFRWRL